MPLLQNIMLSIFPPEKRGSAMGMSGIVIASTSLSPTLSGWIIDHYDWRSVRNGQSDRRFSLSLSALSNEECD